MNTKVAVIDRAWSASRDFHVLNLPPITNPLPLGLPAVDLPRLTKIFRLSAKFFLCSPQSTFPRPLPIWHSAPGHSLVISLWTLVIALHRTSVLPPPFHAQMSTLPSQVPAFTIFTFKKTASASPRSIHGPFSPSPTSLRHYVAKSLSPQMLPFPSQVPAITLFNLFYPRPTAPRSTSFHPKSPAIPPIPGNSTYDVPRNSASNCRLDRSGGSANFTGSVYKRPCAGTGRRRSTRRRRTLSLVNGKISTRNPRLENGRGFFVNHAPQPR
jgi:hypothetical protein